MNEQKYEAHCLLQKKNREKNKISLKNYYENKELLQNVKTEPSFYDSFDLKKNDKDRTKKDKVKLRKLFKRHLKQIKATREWIIAWNLSEAIL